MMMITYIMGHTLTIEENTTYSVIEAVRHSPKPQHTTPHTSPRLANRQLKFFFCVLRNQVYENILNWQQQTLHSSKPSKEQTWLPAFCVMLGFAMVLEEVQRTIHIQADAKAQKGEMTTEQADTEAINACARIDERFKLLIGLFQCKYRDRKWGANGSFGNQTPQLHGEECERDFLAQLYLLMLEKRKSYPKAIAVRCPANMIWQASTSRVAKMWPWRPRISAGTRRGWWRGFCCRSSRYRQAAPEEAAVMRGCYARSPTANISGKLAAATTEAPPGLNPRYQ